MVSSPPHSYKTICQPVVLTNETKYMSLVDPGDAMYRNSMSIRIRIRLARNSRNLWIMYAHFLFQSAAV
jgi:hypothetical protein